MIYLMGCHWYEKIVFKDGVDDWLILVMLLGSDVRFENGIKYWYIIGLCLDLKFDWSMVLKAELSWYWYLDVYMVSNMDFYLDIFFDRMLVLKIDVRMGS